MRSSQRSVAKPVATRGMAIITSAMTAMISRCARGGAHGASSRSGVAPASVKTTHAATTIAAKLVMNSRSAPAASAHPAQLEADAHCRQRRHERDSDGNAGQRIRTGASHRDVRTSRPAASATPRSSMSRRMCARGATASAPAARGMIDRTTMKPIAHDQARPATTCTKVITIHAVARRHQSAAKATIAPPSGATTIAPMIEATESWYRPKDAMNAASVAGR